MVDDFDVTHVPQSRVEEQLENMDGGTNPRRVPQSRVEYLLDEMINGGAGLVPEGVQGQYVGYDSNGKGLAISPDTEPIGLSNKLITSGAVYAAIAAFPKGIVYRGAVDYYVQLPVNAKEGDAYTVRYTGQSGTEPDGTEYARGMLNGSLQWIAIGPDLTRIISMINTKQDILTFDQTPADGSSNPVTSDGIYDALATKQDTLTFDSTPTENSDNPVTSDGIYDAIATKQDTLTFDSTPTENSDNPVTSDGIYDALATKQDTLTFDNAPTENSSNPVTSDGIYDALATKQDTLTFDNTPTENSDNPVTSGGIYDVVSTKQDAAIVQEVTLFASDWSNQHTQTISVPSVLSNEALQYISISPKTTDISAYGEAKIKAVGQGAGTVTFECSETPVSNITVYVMVMNVKSMNSITFMPNGSSDAKYSQIVQTNVSTALDSCEFTAPEGKTFAGWNTAADGTGTAYTDGQSVMVTSNLVLYATWNDARYIVFSSPSTFTLATNNGSKNWDGTLETSTDGSTWTTWDGTSAIGSSNDGKLYVRGSNNTVITGEIGEENKWVLTGSDIACSGSILNILNYLDYSSIVVADYCFYQIFYDCESLISAPSLPLMTLSEGCYWGMFSGCISLVTAPVLPATLLADYCYDGMFSGCTSLTTAPVLPATTLAQHCYDGMFGGTGLVTPPVLPAMALEEGCYSNMFMDCPSLSSAPALPATTLSMACYYGMFSGCDSLTGMPELPATVLVGGCYEEMFMGCQSIKISATQDENYTIPYQTIPYGGDTSQTAETLEDYAMGMFYGTGGRTIDPPRSNTMYYLHKDNTIVPAST